MKCFALIPLLLFTSCASRPNPRVVVQPLSPPAVEPTESVRYAEVIRAYHIGRYVDPSNPDTMHERHSVYRVEAHTRWYLKPVESTGSSVTLLNPPPDAAFSPPPTNDAVLAELNRQRDATERVMREAAQLARSYGELQKVINDMSVVAKNHSWMGPRIVNAERRVGELEAELRMLNAPPASATNDVRSFSIEAPRPAKP